MLCTKCIYSYSIWCDGVVWVNSFGNSYQWPWLWYPWPDCRMSVHLEILSRRAKMHWEWLLDIVQRTDTHCRMIRLWQLHDSDDMAMILHCMWFIHREIEMFTEAIKFPFSITISIWLHVITFPYKKHLVK